MINKLFIFQKSLNSPALIRGDGSMMLGGCMKMAFVAAGVALLQSMSVYADELASIRILALSPAEARAVLKDESGLVQILVPGDSLLGGKFRVREVLVDRLVLTDTKDGKTNAMTWLFKPNSEQALPRVQRFAVEPQDEAVVMDVIESSSRLEEN
jgi:hypothetical protein